MQGHSFQFSTLSFHLLVRSRPETRKDAGRDSQGNWKVQDIVFGSICYLYFGLRH